MDPKRVTEIEQILTNRHDMLHYNMKALRRAGLDLLAEMRSMEQQLHMAAKEAARCCCPYDTDKPAALKFCNESCETDEEKPELCWLEYWQLKINSQNSGAFYCWKGGNVNEKQAIRPK